MNVALCPYSLGLCGLRIPPKRMKAFLHVSACVLFVADCVAGLILVYYLPPHVVGATGAGSKVAAALESVSMFIEEGHA